MLLGLAAAVSFVISAPLAKRLLADPREPHSHLHHHDELTHSHPHVSDVHHRHVHSPH